ncbi:hypothetical protein PHYPO_G00066900 [Pangasianodon hypophthalmus]|uniref:non-specific serine/threonine protein kinase n=1 Tax=Pangasianodon hypophthalmus TaxID=310915 RepID=A0A5N5LTQ9_PANHP|nr:hypothetical protein PHYPO_G00066900 [Pangasianodon hypophthalmus]
MAEIATLLFKGYGCVRRKLGCVKNQEDWCLPLACLLCSAAAGDEHRKAMIQMGDDFGSRGWIYAAHICYVVAHLELGSRRRFQLIGCEWVLNYQSVLKEEMERTEVYEYVASLTSGIGQPRFQEFKYLYACDLAKAGLSARALDYCESIARTIFKFPRLISSYFIERVIMLCKELLRGKEEEEEEEEEVEWLLKLCRLHRAFSAPSSSFSVGSCSYESQEFQEELDSRYTVGELLGKGSFGTVYAGVRKADGKQVAIKYVTKAPEDSFPGAKPLEVALMEMVSKPPRCENVVELLEWFDVSTSFVLVLERPIPCMDLQKFRASNKNGQLSECLAREIMWQVVQAVRHCYNRRVLHGDIRSENILINTDTLEVKLIDFGCGELLSDNLYTSYAGHSSYIWSLGVLLVEMICGDICFHYVDRVIEMCSRVVSGECCHLISWCLKNPENRPTFDEILSHAWFTEEFQDTVQVRELE